MPHFIKVRVVLFEINMFPGEYLFDAWKYIKDMLKVHRCKTVQNSYKDVNMTVQSSCFVFKLLSLADMTIDGLYFFLFFLCFVFFRGCDWNPEQHFFFFHVQQKQHTNIWWSLKKHWNAQISTHKESIFTALAHSEK